MAQTKEQKAVSGRKHYAKNREKLKQRAMAHTRANREKLKAFVQAYKECHPCVDCKNDNWIVLDFDHVRGEKIRHVCDMVNRSVGLKTLEEEIAKCEVVCANCHRIRTHNRRETTRVGETVSRLAHNQQTASSTLAPAIADM